MEQKQEPISLRIHSEVIFDMESQGYPMGKKYSSKIGYSHSKE